MQNVHRLGGYHPDHDGPAFVWALLGVIERTRASGRVMQRVDVPGDAWTYDILPIGRHTVADTWTASGLPRGLRPSLLETGRRSTGPVR